MRSTFDVIPASRLLWPWMGLPAAKKIWATKPHEWTRKEQPGTCLAAVFSHGSHRLTRIFVRLQNDLLYSIRVNPCDPWPAFMYFSCPFVCFSGHPIAAGNQNPCISMKSVACLSVFCIICVVLCGFVATLFCRRQIFVANTCSFRGAYPLN